MREIRTSGSEGGGTGNSTGPSYPYQVLKAVESEPTHRAATIAFRGCGVESKCAPEFEITLRCVC